MNKFLGSVLKSMKEGSHAIKLCTKSRGAEAPRSLCCNFKTLGRFWKNQASCSSRRRQSLRCRLLPEYAKQKQDYLCQSFFKESK